MNPSVLGPLQAVRELSRREQGDEVREDHTKASLSLQVGKQLRQGFPVKAGEFGQCLDLIDGNILRQFRHHFGRHGIRATGGGESCNAHRSSVASSPCLKAGVSATPCNWLQIIPQPTWNAGSFTGTLHA